MVKSSHIVKQENVSSPSLFKSMVPRFSPQLMYLRNGTGTRGLIHTKPPQRTYAQRINHIWSERERRKDMQNLYDLLRSMLPQSSSNTAKLDRCGVVSEAMEFIRCLQQQIEDLKGRKEMLQREQESRVPTEKNSAFATGSTGLHICDSDVFVNVSCKNRPRLISSVLWILRQHQVIVQNLSLSVTCGLANICVHSKAIDIKHLAKESLQSSLQTLARS